MPHLATLAMAVAATLALATGAGAQSPASMTPASAAPVVAATPAPAPNFAPIAFLVGTWSCKRTASTDPTNPPGITWSSTFALTLNKQFVLDTTTAKSQPGAKIPYVGYTYYTYDPLIKQWVNLQVNNYGGYDLGFSKGPSHGTVVWKEAADSADGFPRWTTTWTIASPTAYSAVYVGPTDAKGHVHSLSTSCTKT